MTTAAVCEAAPSLALLKYWGKRDAVRNIPATPSIAVSLEGLRTATHVRLHGPGEGPDRVVVNGAPQPPARFEKFFQAVRGALGAELRFDAESTNNFPTSAGLASSSSGFAALALACTRAAERELPLREVSSLARIGSVSAARAVFGGFTLLSAGASAARQLFDETHWPELRIIVCVVEEAEKEISSRAAMERTRLTSPYFSGWVRASRRAVPQVLRALKARDIEQLGEAMRLSYLRMFATIIASDPPVQYWQPQSVAIINECEAMRRDGLGVWETMDAGPQVKLACLRESSERIRERIEELDIGVRAIECPVAAAPRCSGEGG